MGRAAETKEIMSPVTNWLNPARTRTIDHCWTALVCRNEEEKCDSPSPGKIKSHGRRKPFTPRPSPPRNDPTFVGVIFRFKAVLLNDETRLDVDAQYEGFHSRRKTPIDSLQSSSGDSPPQSTSDTSHSSAGSSPGTPSGRQCASCNTRRTALWRGAEDGTPLCNACGIR
ncbi:hypothetical protein LSAT2_003396 [Lamellibrachia satsuma]|nr:hypothetical protein LSAT2_003396 [Lamellibrachia satsuma]